MKKAAAIECVLLRPGLEATLADMLAEIDGAGGREFFHPHPVDRQTLERLAANPGEDLYFLFFRSGRALAYGLLRGWNEGFPIPSLGIAVHPSARRRGVGQFVMAFLENTARLREAPAVRLRVRPENVGARQLYALRGYAFNDTPDADGLIVGMKPLDKIR